MDVGTGEDILRSHGRQEQVNKGQLPPEFWIKMIF
jgi:hypothetical protein